MAFHVPDDCRVTTGPLSSAPGAGQYGAFRLLSPEPGWTLWLVCDDGADPDHPTGWEHVSVSARRGNKVGDVRTPTWKEMVYVKATCWDPEDVVVQFHPRQSEYVNVHPHVLHLWRHRELVFPTPPADLVG